ncbi:cache domain-containing sensor histidine kinase [Paenibacillus puerhi]|uniref:cache domain-containing sensor histidine kinase n=1 Tax=Paenibacillus puerhi TaxID=2692622 RepID=UPI0013585BB1|nr:sensor histidine kinase [Paenibacillus puerhi]
MNRAIEWLDQQTNNMKLRPKLMITFYFISIVPLVVTAAFFYLTLTQSLGEEVGASMVQTTRQVDERISSFTEETTHLTKIIQFDSNTQAFLDWEDPADLSLIPSLQALRSLISTVTNQNTHLRSIHVINDHGNFLAESKDMFKLRFDFLHDPWYKEVVQHKGFRLLPAHEQNYVQGASVVSFAGRIFKVSDLKESGTLLLDFDTQFLSSMIDTIQVGKTGSVYLISREGKSVVSPGEDGESQSLIKQLYSQPAFNQDQGYLLTKINEVNTLVGFSTSKTTGWKIVAAVPFHELSGKIEALKWIILVLVCVALCFIVILAKYLSQAITSPMIRLAEYMKRVEKGDLSARVPIDRGDELGLLTRRFNHMLEQVQVLEEVVYLSEIRETRLQLLNRESELKALQMQINPHFLHNTLNTIKCVGEVYDVKEVAIMSEGLSEMFRYSIDTDKYKLLRQEIDHVQAYIQIIQVRYPERIRCHFDIPAHLEEQPVLKLILQPLVENAIEHGLIPKSSDGDIWISASVTNRKELVLRVVDNGVGLTSERLREIKQKLSRHGDEAADGEEPLVGHVGLYNVSQRLFLNYDGLGRLDIDYDSLLGTIAEIRLPLDEDREADINV